MNSDLLISIVQKLNARIKREGRKIILFLDHAPCHPDELVGMFSNVAVTFLPKNTTSRTQCLDAGVIKNCKVKYRKQLLQYVCRQIDDTNGPVKASEIVKSIFWRRSGG